MPHFKKNIYCLVPREGSAGRTTGAGGRTTKSSVMLGRMVENWVCMKTFGNNCCDPITSVNITKAGILPSKSFLC